MIGATPVVPDIEEVRTFCVAAELGSLGRAAGRLGVSQPALSKRLAHLEALAGVRLLERTAQGVRLTPAGRRLYEEAHRLLQQADLFAQAMAAASRTSGPIRVATSHSAMEAIVAEVLASRARAGRPAIELVIANSGLVREFVAGDRADVGIAAARPDGAPYHGVRQLPLASDAIICAVPPGHRWAHRDTVALEEFQTTPMVMRDPDSNSRWTIAAQLAERQLDPPPVLVEAGTPQAAIREARSRCAPVLLSRRVLAGHGLHEVRIADLAFPRSYVVLLPGRGEPLESVSELLDELRQHAAEEHAAPRMRTTRRGVHPGGARTRR